VGTPGGIRVPEAICRVLCQFGDRGEVRKGYRDSERRRRFLGRESRGASELLSIPHFIRDDHLFYDWKGELKTSVRETERNAVTWGVFPGQEIVQSTIIEQESFLTWKVRSTARSWPRRSNGALQDEAFSIWTDWARQFSPESQERQLLERIRNTRWLVNVTHHDFKNPEALWSFLFEDIGLDNASLT